MKSVLFFLICLFSLQLNAQLSISTNLRQDAIWRETEEKWDVLSEDPKGTLFEFNKDLTMFKHTTETITSTYYINKWEYNEEQAKYTMTVTSDAGNEYEMIVDGINNCVAFFYYLEDKYILVRHSIKNTWIKD